MGRSSDNLIRVALLALAGGAVLAPGCIARDTGKFEKQYLDDAGSPPPNLVDSGVGFGDAKGDVPVSDPHAVLGVEPPHGPWNGGQLALVRGNGFSSDVRVWFGDKEIPQTDVVPVDPKRVQVVVPQGDAGAVDVRVRNGNDGSTERTLTGGYTYDEFYAEPASGPTSGGTIITLHGQATQWTAGTEVFVDLKPCATTTVLGPTEIECTTPPGTPGVKSLRVKTPDLVNVDVLDAFTYGDSENGYKGGLSGQPLKDQIKVLALDSYEGAALEGATVIVGDDLSTAAVKKTDSGGVAVVQQKGLGPKRTVTVAMKCFSPITFVDVPVDTVTAYLDPVLSPKCASEGDPPPVGGSGSLSGAVTGQLLWDGNKEFERAGWTNVPAPQSEDEKRVAYVFRLASDPTNEFQLPSAGAAVTPESTGNVGFDYQLTVGGGNVTLYALAGLENRKLSPPKFIAYAMGIAKGVSSKPGQVTSDVFIKVDIPLDHAVALDVTGPTPTTKGPDRIVASTAVRVGEQGYAIFPVGKQTKLLPISGNINFIGLPPLTEALNGSQYVVSAEAVTGVAESTPRSVTAALATTVSGPAIPISDFVEVPKLLIPADNGAWTGTELAWAWLPGGESVDLSVLTLSTGGGLVNWTVAAPPGVTQTKLPDLSQLGLGLSGPITIGVSVAHIVDFDYGSLRYRQLGDRGWNAYATDVFYAHL